jgi:hypothetical protein
MSVGLFKIEGCKMNCDKCIHSGICKNEDAARNWETNFKTTVDPSKPDCIELIFKCKNYSLKYATVRGIENTR